MPRVTSLATRWLGVGLASMLAAVTIGLWATDRLALYINPDSAWFAVGMAVVVLVGAVATFALPLGAEADHGHDHGAHDDGSLSERSETKRLDVAHRVSSPRFARRSTTGGVAAAEATGEAATAEATGRAPARSRTGGVFARSMTGTSAFGLAATVTGGIAASGIVLLTLVLPPASLSAEVAMSRDVGAPPLFAGADVVSLATTGDTASFGIGEWAAVFATATNPEAFDGDAVTLTGFVTPGDGGFDLTRLVITHCVIDAQTASIPISSTDAAPETGQWVTVTGTVRATTDGRLAINPTSVEQIAEPGDPYEY